MADPATLQLLPDLVLGEILVRLPPSDFHRCRCLSRAWAATLSSDDVIDHHLRLRGKIRLDYDDVMSGLLLDCCIDDYDDYANKAGFNVSEEKESLDTAAKEETAAEDGGGDGDGDGKTVSDWREEYRTRGYVEVDQDYYTRREEMEAMLAREWANRESIKAEIDVTDSDSDDDDRETGSESDRVEYGAEFTKADDCESSKAEIDVADPDPDNDHDEWETGSESEIDIDYSAEFTKACTVPYGALHPRIRQPFLEEDPPLDCSGGQGGTEGHDGLKPIRGREKTEEEVDQEIIAFLRRLRDMDPQPQFLREFDTYRWPWPIPQQGQDELEDLEEEVGQEDGLDYSDDSEVDEESDAVNL